MEHKPTTNKDMAMEKPQHSDRHGWKHVLNLISIGLLLVIGYFSYALLSQSAKPIESVNQNMPAGQARVIQLDVLNGCGAKGVGSKFTTYLRSCGFDVVEMKNYKTFNVQQTLIVDRIGDLELARRVASALGVSSKNIIQQINPDYFVDVSVVIGNDFVKLSPTKQ